MIRKFISRNPFTNQIMKEFPFASSNEITEIILRSNVGFRQNKSISLKQRLEKLEVLGSHIENNVKKYAELITTETGKPIHQSTLEVKKCQVHCKYYIENAVKFLKLQLIKSEARKCYVEYQPLGSIYVLVPFNFPFWLAFKPIIPYLVAGNAVLMRNSDSTPLIGLALEELFKASGFDSGEFLNVYSSPDQSDDIISNPLINGVSFCGSSRTGSILSSLAGKHLKKSVMELGGCDPFLVLPDADLELATTLALKSRITNAGQICFCAKRFLIAGNVYDEFVDKLKKKLEVIKTGDPFSDKTELGPISRTDLVENLENFLEKTVKEGAEVIAGDIKRVAGTNIFKPIILEVKNVDNISFKEEIFGPVFPLIKIENEKDFEKVANHNDYGLGACIISKDIKKAEDLAEKINCGMIFINDIVKSDSRMPSGGIKKSGYGRDCGEFGLKEFTNIKLVYIN